MDDQGELFDRDESERRKEEGMEQAADNRPSDLELARKIALELCIKNGFTHADAVGKVLYDRHGIESLGGAAGSLFKGSPLFACTGQMVKSARKKNHGRNLYVWALKG